MSAAADALDRRNNLVWDAIEANNPKRALDLCNTRIKRGEKADSLDVLKCYTLSLLSSVAGIPQPDLPHYSECRTLAKALTSRKTPITDTHSLGILQRIYMSMRFDGTELSGAWERAVKAVPHDLKLAKQWFLCCVRFGDLRGAQKAAMGLQKVWVHDRDFYFWAISSTMILFSSLGDDQKDRPIFKTLAYRMAVKTREDAKLSPPPARSIQKPQEIHLLLQVIATCTPKPEDALKEQLAVLDSDDIGVNSKLAEGDWWSFVRKRLEILEELKDWTRIYDICRSLIKSSVEKLEGGLPGKGDDWKIWESLLQATEELGKGGEDKTTETKEIITSHIETVPLSRNALLARIRFEKAYKVQTDGDSTGVAAAVVQYLERFQTKDCCFPDLKAEVETLDTTSKKTILEALKANAEKLVKDGKPSTKSVIAETNYLKLRYLFTIANLQDKSESAEKQDEVSSAIEALDALSISDRPETAEERIAILQSFTKDALATYNAAVSLGPTELATDNHCGDDSAILAAMACIRLYHLSPAKFKSSLLKAITVLEDALSRSVHDYQILLLLTRLYLLLGAPTTAYKIYKRLSIKQIQNDTMSHYYFSRISSLHPGDSEISRELGLISKLYHNIQRQIPDMLVTAYEQSSYGQLEGFVQLGDRLNLSYWRAISRLERLRTIRFRNEPPVDLPKAPALEWDNRDFGIMYNFELSSQPSFEARFLRTGPLQGKGWTSVFDQLEIVSDALVSKDGKLDTSVSQNILTLLQDSTVASELTEAEKKHATAVAAIASVLAESTEDAVTKLITHLEEFTKREESTTGLPWERLHENVTDLQTLTFTKLLVDNKAFKGVKALRKQQTDLKQAATAAAKVVKERLQNKDVKFVDDETVKAALEGWAGEPVEGVKKLAQELRQAQREAGRFGVNGWKKGF
ncbi:hypothetical protein BJ508DRAFT_413553 [Ascobolus immersus RN42]|uniref:N-acetyltransferase B complex non catalytic subunit n=1 Tax=Ascobolus immersus RN42 TaxID=1160509 RepID=A0A3N4ICY6_ASCIM|nr:hypothetical protein BJ508DRAFT_413553 [Ascobolus immersus RN42]